MSVEDTSRNKGTVPTDETPPQRRLDVQALVAQVEELEQRLSALEGVFSERVIDKENSHVKAQDQDAREQLNVGETAEIVVEEPPEENGGNAVTHVNGIVTFIKDAEGASKGDPLTVRFTDVDDNYAHAIAVER